MVTTKPIAGVGKPTMLAPFQPSTRLSPNHYDLNKPRGCTTRSAATDEALQTSSTTPVAPASGPACWPSAAARQAAFSTTSPEYQPGVQAEISGRLPEWLQGAYVRNGPGTYENGTSEGMAHMFDGYACLLKMEVNGSNNTVTASHRFLESKAYQAFKTDGKMKWREFATAVPTEGWVAKAVDVATMALGSMGIMQGVTDNASVNVLQQGDEIWAMTETVAGTYAVDPATLRTLGPVRYADALKGDLTTAHPTVLPNGDVINLLSAPGVGFTMYRQPYRAHGSGAMLPERRRLAAVGHKRPLAPAWVHDFPSSVEHAVVPETPLYFNLGSLMLGHQTEHIFLDWVPTDGTRLHVVRLSDGVVKTFTCPAFFVFHWANAFEKTGADGRQLLCIDGAVYQDPTIVTHLYLDGVRAGPDKGSTLPPSHFMRLTLDLDAPDGSEVPGQWEHLIKEPASYGNFVEFPCVNPTKKGRGYQFAWTTCAVQPTNVNNALAKMDVVSGECLVWHEAGGVVGEPAFVPRPGAAAEDDGVVLSVITQPDGKAAMLVLDGQSHEEITRAGLPYSLTNGFHGAFMTAK